MLCYRFTRRGLGVRESQYLGKSESSFCDPARLPFAYGRDILVDIFYIIVNTTAVSAVCVVVILYHNCYYYCRQAVIDNLKL
jgi:hypothetical protein